MSTEIFIALITDGDPTEFNQLISRIIIMKKQNLALSATAVAISLALAACGGASSGGGLAATTTTTSQGVITGFGSVFVNGVEYNTNTATSINMEGVDSPESALKVGMLVTLQGAVNADGKTGTATAIKYANQMEGVVNANTVAANGSGTLTVMGETVNVTADTIFESDVATITAPNLIQVGNIVEVSGYASSSGVVTATRIEVKAAALAAGAVIELKGTISGLNATNKTFMLGSVAVDYSGVTPADLPNVALADGQYVEVKTTTSYAGTGNLIAASIELTDDGVKGHDGQEGEDLDVKGLVTADFANDQFELNGRSVTIDSNTEFEHGDTSQLVAGTKVKVETHFDASGNLIADSIDFKQASELEFEATLEAADTTANTVTIMGQVIYVDNNTVMLDDSDAAVRFFKLADLSAANSDHLEVNAFQDSTTGHLIATKLERKNYSAEAMVKGTADTTSGLLVAGIAVDTATAVGTVPTLSTGTKVEITGTYSNGVLHANEVALDH